MNKKGKFIVFDATDIMCIGGFGNDKGNIELLKYSEEEISNMMIENNTKVDDIRLANSLLNTIKKQKEVIDTILNWDIFKNECPMNFGYDEETNEDKAQDVFYKDDDYCENNCNDDYTKCWLKYFKRMHELEKGDSNE